MCVCLRPLYSLLFYLPLFLAPQHQIYRSFQLRSVGSTCETLAKLEHLSQRATFGWAKLAHSLARAPDTQAKGYADKNPDRTLIVDCLLKPHSICFPAATTSILLSPAAFLSWLPLHADSAYLATLSSCRSPFASLTSISLLQSAWQ